MEGGLRVIHLPTQLNGQVPGNEYQILKGQTNEKLNFDRRIYTPYQGMSHIPVLGVTDLMRV